MRGIGITKGLRQGCCMSPSLFKMCVENFLKTCTMECTSKGVNMNAKELITLHFTADQIIITDIRQNLKKILT